MLESIFHKVADFSCAATLLKSDSNPGFFLWNLRNFKNTYFEKLVNDQLLLWFQTSIRVFHNIFSVLPNSTANSEVSIKTQTMSLVLDVFYLFLFYVIPQQILICSFHQNPHNESSSGCILVDILYVIFTLTSSLANDWKKVQIRGTLHVNFQSGVKFIPRWIQLYLWSKLSSWLHAETSWNFRPTVISTLS